MTIWIAIYILSVIVTGGIILYEYKRGVVYGYKFSTKEYVYAFLMSVLPVVNTLFGVYLIIEYTFARN